MTSTYLTQVSNELESLEVIPASFSSSLQGQLIAGTNAGTIIAFDPSNLQTTPIATSSGNMSDIIFSESGVLYAVSANNLMTVDASGTVSNIVSSFSAADGLAYDPDLERLFVSDSDLDVLYEYDIYSASLTTLGGYDFDSGYFTSGLLWGSNGYLLILTGESVQTQVVLSP